MVSNEIQSFDFESRRLVASTCEDGQSIFVGVDVCRILDLKNPADAFKSLDADEKMTLVNSEGHSGRRGGAQKHIWITESGLYALIFKSRKPEAKRFRKWVTSEVLPALRKTGSYSLLEAKVAKLTVDHKRVESELTFSELVRADLEEAVAAMQPPDSEYMTLRRFCDHSDFGVYDDSGRSPKGAIMRVQWRLLKIISDRRGASVIVAQSPAFGRVNMYRLDVLREWATLFRMRSFSSDQYLASVRRYLGL